MEIKGRFDHFNINVTDLDRSLAFYREALGLHEIKRKEAADGSFVLAYLGDDRTGFRLELTWLRDHAAAPTSWAKTKAISACAWRATTTPCASTTVRAGGMLRKPRHGALLHQRSRRLLDRGTARQITARTMPTQKNDALRREIDAAAEVLRKGGLILYPTDTVWGIGCDATNEEAVARIYALKRSQNKKSMLVLCASADMTVRYVDRAPGIAFEVQEMATSPLTLILPGAAGVAANLIPEEGTLGVRIPDHEFCQGLLRRFGRPIVSTSANITGEPTPKRLPEIAREIVDGVDYVVNPRFEGRPTGKPSSIIAFTEDGGVKVIRQ